jgi:hypothetical protein
MKSCVTSVGLVVGLLCGLCLMPPAVSADDYHPNLRAVPFVFVGTADECGVAGSRIVTSAWLGGMGLPDNGGLNTTLLDLAENPNKRDPHMGLLLNKNGPTPDCSSSGARILGAEGMLVTTTFTLGFDYRLGGHCGAGAPRFNVVVKPLLGPETFHFVGGCSNAVPTPAPQDPLEWESVRFLGINPAQAFPPIPPGSRIRSITLLYDEGTDTPTVSSPLGVGLAVVDNIYINGRFIRSGRGIMPHPRDDGDDDCDNDGVKDYDDEDDDNDGMHDDWDTDDDNDGILDADAVLTAHDLAAILGSLIR